MDNKERKSNVTSSVIVAVSLIVAGIMIIGRNVGIVPDYIYHIIISWQMLLIVVGIDQFLRWKTTAGTVLVIIGGAFMLPEIFNFTRIDAHLLWPIIFIIVGAIILLNTTVRHSTRLKSEHHEFKSEEGFIKSDNSLSSIERIITDPLFKGAEIRNVFGMTMIDLRQTALEGPETTINVDCSFGKVELLIPACWSVKLHVNLNFSNCEDKRDSRGIAVDNDHHVTVNGRVSFGGIEIH